MVSLFFPNQIKNERERNMESENDIIKEVENIIYFFKFHSFFQFSAKLRNEKNTNLFYYFRFYFFLTYLPFINKILYFAQIFKLLIG
jgi:hypothetical protein